MLHMGKLYGWPHQLVILLICLMILAKLGEQALDLVEPPSPVVASPPRPARQLPPWAVPSQCWSCSGSASRWWGLHGAIWLLDSLFFSRPSARGPGKLTLRAEPASCTGGLLSGPSSSASPGIILRLAAGSSPGDLLIGLE